MSTVHNYEEIKDLLFGKDRSRPLHPEDDDLDEIIAKVLQKVEIEATSQSDLGMNTVEPSKVADVIGNVRMTVCGYATKDYCDCKFGGDNVGRTGWGEQTGCPELRQAEYFYRKIAALRNQTGEE